MRKYYEEKGMVKDKVDGVLTYEMGMTKMMIENNVKPVPFVPIKEMMQKY